MDKMNGLDTLNTMSDKMKAEAYPNVPVNYIPNSKYKDATANELTASILRWLTINNHYCSRIQSQGQYQPKLGIFTPSTVKRGIGDILAIINGKTLMVEVKVNKDRLSEFQKDTQIQVEQSGGTYVIARDFQTFFEWYQNFVK
jgi:hypothetical protein